MVKSNIISALQNEFRSDFQYEKTKTDWSLFGFINNIKLDIVHYRLPLIKSIDVIDGIRLLSVEDIAAMKINAILGRAQKKDFWDIHELLHHFTLSEIIGFYQQKFPEQILLISISQALVYFEEAEASVDPVCLKGYSWESVKKSIQNAVRQYLQ